MEIPRGRGVAETKQVFIEKYGAGLEFPDGWEVKNQKTLLAGMNTLPEWKSKKKKKLLLLNTLIQPLTHPHMHVCMHSLIHLLRYRYSDGEQNSLPA